jgi:hypothetical protein
LVCREHGIADIVAMAGAVTKGGAVFQSDGHHPIDMSAFQPPPTPPAPTASRRLKSLLARSRSRRTDVPPPTVVPPPITPGPPGVAKWVKNTKTTRDAKREAEPSPPRAPATEPREPWPPPMPTAQRVSLPASILYVLWRAVVLAGIAAFQVARLVCLTAVRVFAHLLD